MLILLITILIVGLSIGLYLISQKTSWFTSAGSTQMTIPSPLASPTSTTASSEQTYDNPFVDTETYENPFDEL